MNAKLYIGATTTGVFSLSQVLNHDLGTQHLKTGFSQGHRLSDNQT